MYQCTPSTPSVCVPISIRVGKTKKKRMRKGGGGECIHTASSSVCVCQSRVCAGQRGVIWMEWWCHERTHVLQFFREGV